MHLAVDGYGHRAVIGTAVCKAECADIAAAFRHKYLPFQKAAVYIIEIDIPLLTETGIDRFLNALAVCRINGMIKCLPVYSCINFTGTHQIFLHNHCICNTDCTVRIQICRLTLHSGHLGAEQFALHQGIVHRIDCAVPVEIPDQILFRQRFMRWRRGLCGGLSVYHDIWSFRQRCIRAQVIACNGREKACNLGGALGRVIQVGSFDELKAACTSSEACTIVITKNISKTGSYTKDGNGRYRFADAKIYVNPNKTIIGSYSAHSLYNVFFQTFGENYGPGHDLIFRNIEISHDKELNSDNIWEFAYGSNYWIDHITFVGHDKVNGASTKTDDWDKFLNFKGNTDFITISDCKFGLHEYGVLLGYPTDDQATYDQYNGHPCVTLANNYYRDCITRAPGLMRYGYFHSLNNYVVNFDMGYTIYTACKLYSESNYFDAGTGKGSVVNDTVSANDISSKYKGAYTDSGSKLVNSRYSLSGKTASACTWRPGTNYTYTAFSADQSKNYCTSYSGAQSSSASMTHSAFVSAGYPSANYIVKPDTTMEPEIIEPISGRLISELLVTDSTRKAWSIKSDLQIGDLVFGDRDVTWQFLPELLCGGEAIVTACDAKYSSGESLVSFKAAADMTLWIGLDNRVEKLPTWMQSYTKSNLTAQNNKDVIFDLYSKSVKTGEQVTLGANGQSSYCVNYAVIATLPKQDITGDGVTDRQDANALQKFLLKNGTLVYPETADLNGDGKIDAIDLALLKRELLVSPAVTTAVTEPIITTTLTTTATVSNAYESADFKFSGKVYLVGDSTVCDYSSNDNASLIRMEC